MNSSFSSDFSPSLAPPPDLTDASLSLLHGLSQHSRLISLETALGPDALIAASFTGREAMSEPFRFDVDCLATSGHCGLEALNGEEASLRIRLADGTMRAFHGIVTEVSQLGSDGALSRYRLTLEPWLHALTLRRDSYVFQDKTVLEIIDEVFRDYPLANYRFDVSTPLPKRPVTMQYRESDYLFVTRLLAEEGLNFYICHDADGDYSEKEAAPLHARHCVVVFDDNAALAQCAQGQIRFHRADATELRDTITLFAQRREVKANTVALSSWDCKCLHAHAAEDRATLGAQQVPPLEIYEGRGADRYSAPGESARIVRARAESLALQYQVCHGESSVRAFSIGYWFELTGHPACKQAEYVVLSLEHQGANNLSSRDTGLLERNTAEAGTYRNHFTCVSRATPIRPVGFPPKPTAGGPQVALVVGVANEEITTERDHRIKVQFPWQRGRLAAKGQLDHPATSNAPGNETAGTWMRLAEPAVGANWGSNFIARIGQEVMIDFIDGDIDRPVVIGQLYNDTDAPPYHSADNHPGALAGMRTKEYGASGFNHWMIDDSPQQLRQSLASSYATSQLNIGYLIRQSGNVRSTFRGTGFELVSDAWGALRATRGLFISTAQKHGAASTQLDTQEAQSRLAHAADLAKALSSAAGQHQALPSSSADGIRQLIDTAEAAHQSDGQSAAALAHPITLLDSDAAIMTATPSSSVALAGQDLSLTSASALRMSAGQAISVAAAQAASLFTGSGGMKVIAAKESVSVRAHTRAMDMLADRALIVTSSNGSIKIQAKQELLLASGGGYIKLAGADIDIHCPSSVTVKGSTHDFLAAGGQIATMHTLPDSEMANPAL